MINLGVATYWVLPVIILAVAYAFFLYWKDKKWEENAKWQVRTMAILRFFSVFLILFFLLEPLVKTFSRVLEKPIIILAQDNSASITQSKDSTFYKTDYLTEKQNFIDKLSDKFTIQTYTFGENVKVNGATDFSEVETDLGAVADEIKSTFYKRNVAVTILASDGLYNKGKNPNYAFSGISHPVLPIAMGDTSTKKDLYINNINNNKIAYLNNFFPVEIDVIASKLKGENSKLKVYHNGEVVAEKDFQIAKEEEFFKFNFNIEAEKSGFRKYTVKAEVIEGEVNKENNIADFYIDIIDSRQKVLILSAFPHPDIGAIRASISQNQNYEVDVTLLKDLKKNLKAYNLVILYQLPAVGVNSQSITDVLKEANIPVWFIVGSKSNIQGFNQLNTGLTIGAGNFKANQVQGYLSPNFSLFTLEEEVGKSLLRLPPLVAPFGDLRIGNNFNVLLNQKVGEVKTETPLWTLADNDGRKTAVLLGEGIWKWRLQNFKNSQNHNNFNQLVNKAVQYLALKEDKRNFKVTAKNIYNQNEQIIINAELYNDVFENINEPEVSMTLENEKNEVFEYNFSRTSDAYRLNIGNLKPGSYEYKAKVDYNNKSYTQQGLFEVKALMQEFSISTADHNLLFSLANESNGKVFYPQDWSKIKEYILSIEDINTIAYTESSTKNIIHNKWLFFVIVLLLSAEWFYRKYLGGY